MPERLASRVIAGHALTRAEALQLMDEADLGALCAAAHRITRRCAGSGFELCSILNAKSGHCSEDCRWCAQSAHAACELTPRPLCGTEECVAHAAASARHGVHRFSLVTSGRRPATAELTQLCAGFAAMAARCSIALCASLGTCTREQLLRLREAGVSRYHCNLETGPGFFPQVCTTHTQEQKITTLIAARAAGLELCSGGIIGMGESHADRVELALTLRSLGVRSVPINVLHPIAGTALGGRAVLEDEEILRTVAVFRFILPEAALRLSGGRALMSERLLKRVLHAGLNAAIVGDLLTTPGSAIEEDKARFRAQGYRFAPRPAPAVPE